MGRQDADGLSVVPKDGRGGIHEPQRLARGGLWQQVRESHGVVHVADEGPVLALFEHVAVLRAAAFENAASGGDQLGRRDVDDCNVGELGIDLLDFLELAAHLRGGRIQAGEHRSLGLEIDLTGEPVHAMRELARHLGRQRVHIVFGQSQVGGAGVRGEQEAEPDARRDQQHGERGADSFAQAPTPMRAPRERRKRLYGSVHPFDDTQRSKHTPYV